jgi:hypothetical protein
LSQGALRDHLEWKREYFLHKITRATKVTEERRMRIIVFAWIPGEITASIFPVGMKAAQYAG